MASYISLSNYFLANLEKNYSQSVPLRYDENYIHNVVSELTFNCYIEGMDSQHGELQPVPITFRFYILLSGTSRTAVNGTIRVTCVVMKHAFYLI